MLGEGAPPLQHSAAQQVGHQGATGADRVDAGVPPEAAVLTGEQGIEQHPRIALKLRLFPVAAVIGRSDRPIGTVVEQQRPSDGRQASPDRHQHGPHEPEQQSSSGQCGRSQDRQPDPPQPPTGLGVVEADFGQIG